MHKKLFQNKQKLIYSLKHLLSNHNYLETPCDRIKATESAYVQR